MGEVVWGERGGGAHHAQREHLGVSSKEKTNVQAGTRKKKLLYYFPTKTRLSKVTETNRENSNDEQRIEKVLIRQVAKGGCHGKQRQVDTTKGKKLLAKTGILQEEKYDGRGTGAMSKVEGQVVEKNFRDTESP